MHVEKAGLVQPEIFMKQKKDNSNKVEGLVLGDENDGNSSIKTQKWTWKNTVQMRRSMAQPKGAVMSCIQKGEDLNS